MSMDRLGYWQGYFQDFFSAPKWDWHFNNPRIGYPSYVIIPWWLLLPLWLLATFLILRLTRPKKSNPSAFPIQPAK